MKAKQSKENRLNVYIDPQLVVKAKLQATIENVSLAHLVESALNSYLKDVTFEVGSSQVSFTSLPTPLTQKMPPNATLERPSQDFDHDITHGEEGINIRQPDNSYQEAMAEVSYTADGVE